MGCGVECPFGTGVFLKTIFSEDSFLRTFLGRFIQAGHSLRNFDWLDFTLFFHSSFLGLHEQSDDYKYFVELLYCDSVGKAHALCLRLLKFPLLDSGRRSRKKKGDVWNQDDMLMAYTHLGGAVAVVKDGEQVGAVYIE